MIRAEILGVNYSFQVIKRPIDVIESTIKSSGTIAFDLFPFFIGLTGAIFHFFCQTPHIVGGHVVRISIESHSIADSSRCKRFNCSNQPIAFNAPAAGYLLVSAESAQSVSPLICI
jgi:hypothetical protein